MPFLFYDYTYIIVLPAIIIALIAQIKVQATFSKYSKIQNSRGITGAEAARQVLLANGVTNVIIENVHGNLTDHFDPSSNVIRLSDSVYASTSVAAVGVAAHEAGHAVQHARGYVPNKIRGAIVPITKIGSYLAFPLFFIGLIFNSSLSSIFINAGIILYSLSVLFTLITLPVEFNASRRALESIKQNNLLFDFEYHGAKKVLSAAAMTYVSATLTALLNLVRLIFISERRR